MPINADDADGGDHPERGAPADRLAEEGADGTPSTLAAVRPANMSAMAPALWSAATRLGSDDGSDAEERPVSRARR